MVRGQDVVLLLHSCMEACDRETVINVYRRLLPAALTIICAATSHLH